MIFQPICKHKYLFISCINNDIEYYCAQKIIKKSKCPINKTYPSCLYFKDNREYKDLR